MDKAKINVQDQVLNVSRKEKIPVEMILLGGERYQGYIQSFDGYCVLLRLEEGGEIMIYKHAISVIKPLQPLPVGRKEGTKEEV